MPNQVIHIAGEAPESRSVPKPVSTLLVIISQMIALGVLLALYLSRNPLDLEPLQFLVTLGPRIAFVVPILLILPVLLYFRQWWLLAENGFLLMIVLGPLMGLNLNGLFHSGLSSETARDRCVRVMSFNIGPYGLDIERLVSYLDTQNVDVLLIQEDSYLWKLKSTLDAKGGWYSNHRNTIFSRFPITAESKELPDEFGGQRIYAGHLDMARLHHEKFDFIVGSAHGPSLRQAFHGFVDHQDLQELKRSMQWQKRQLERIAAMADASDSLPLILGGDFNIPPGSVYSRPLDKRFIDVFAAVGTGYGFTFPT
ncbi:MAG: hypothetical protein RJA81_1194, partial [Planctomycetota bacterium]